LRPDGSWEFGVTGFGGASNTIHTIEILPFCVVYDTGKYI